jgi:hypothetical protein
MLKSDTVTPSQDIYKSGHMGSQYQSYWEAENTRKLQSSTLSREYEIKLIDDVLNSKGVSVKPTETLLKDFIKRLKTLNKDIVCDVLNEKLMKFNEMEDNDQIRVLIVSYIINPLETIVYP